MKPPRVRNFRLVLDERPSYSHDAACQCSSPNNYPSPRCHACMVRLERRWDHAEALAAIEATREPFFRGALRCALAIRWGMESVGSALVCRYGWHITSGRDGRCIFCRTRSAA